MKISNKIILLIVLLLSGLSFSAWSGLNQMRQIRLEYSAMVTFDVALMRGVNSVYQIQLQKNVLLQQLISISEELGRDVGIEEVKPVLVEKFGEVFSLTL